VSDLAATIPAMTGKSIALFIAAALAEIGGAYLVWIGLKEDRGAMFVVLGVIALGPDRRNDLPGRGRDDHVCATVGSGSPLARVWLSRPIRSRRQS
jgi:hypothetical protein